MPQRLSPDARPMSHRTPTPPVLSPLPQLRPLPAANLWPATPALHRVCPCDRGLEGESPSRLQRCAGGVVGLVWEREHFGELWLSRVEIKHVEEAAMSEISRHGPGQAFLLPRLGWVASTLEMAVVPSGWGRGSCHFNLGCGSDSSPPRIRPSFQRQVVSISRVGKGTTAMCLLCAAARLVQPPACKASLGCGK